MFAGSLHRYVCFTENLEWYPCAEHPLILLSSVVFVFSVNALTSCIFYTSVMSKILFVTLTNVACCYAQKFNSLYILAHECGQDSDVGVVTCYGLDSGD